MSRSQETIDKINRLLNHPSTHPNIKAAAQARIDHINKTNSDALHPHNSSEGDFHKLLMHHGYKPVFDMGIEKGPITGDYLHHYEHSKYRNKSITVASKSKTTSAKHMVDWSHYHNDDDSEHGNTLDALHKNLMKHG